MQILFTATLERGFPGSSIVKNPSAKQETWVQSLVQEDTLEKEMATHSNILTWEIPWTEDPGARVLGVAKCIRYDLVMK